MVSQETEEEKRFRQHPYGFMEGQAFVEMSCGKTGCAWWTTTTRTEVSPPSRRRFRS
jgi:hypothetical protein